LEFKMKKSLKAAIVAGLLAMTSGAAMADGIGIHVGPVGVGIGVHHHHRVCEWRHGHRHCFYR
jgi:hypothetical protein